MRGSLGAAVCLVYQILKSTFAEANLKFVQHEIFVVLSRTICKRKMCKKNLGTLELHWVV